jgi:hypothetical protein
MSIDWAENPVRCLLEGVHKVYNSTLVAQLASLWLRQEAGNVPL